jgi:superoxide dismutase, Cu-Zn family
MRKCRWIRAGVAGISVFSVWAVAALSWAEQSFKDVEQAVALLRPTMPNSQANGIVIFSPTESGVEVWARISGLPSGTRHGFHVHVFGDCSDVLTGSAGPHFDPTGNMMRMMQTGMLPLGDLENLSAGEDGTVEVRFKARDLTIAGAQNAILGRGLMLHESYSDPNDPMSSSGDAIACGTIGVYNKDRTTASASSEPAKP